MALISTVSYGLLTLLGFSIRPDTRPTEGAVGSTCIGLYVRNGSVSCSNDGSETVCEVVCGGRQRGKFTCTEEKGWIPNLPTCAKTIKETDDDEFLKAESEGCQSQDVCMQWCQRQGKKTGSIKSVCSCSRN